jgi:hypothetical protein
VGALRLVVTDHDGPVAGALVTSVGPGPALSGRTDAGGIVTLRVAPVRTSTWTLVVTAGGHTSVSTRWTLTVVPAVSVRWQGTTAVVTVTPARGQLMTVRHGSKVVARRVLPTAWSARMSVTVPRTGGVSVTVGAAGGLAAVTTVRPGP